MEVLIEKFRRLCAVRRSAPASRATTPPGQFITLALTGARLSSRDAQAPPM